MFLFRLTFWFARFGVKMVLAVALLGTIVLVLYASFWLPDVAFLAENPPETTAFIERARSSGGGEGEAVRIRRTWVPLEQISPQLINAVRVAEDDRFYQHNGFDFTEIKNSIEKNLEEGRFARGGSTLSQQLAKNLYLSSEKTLRRKFDEMLITWKLEKNLTKDRILELYLNVVEWGNGCFGAEAASRFYFSKSASDLTEREAANLAARLPNPGYLGSYSGEKKRRERERIILSRMKKAGPASGKTERVAKEKEGTAANAGPNAETKNPQAEEGSALPTILEIAQSIEPLRKKLTEVLTEPKSVEVSQSTEGFQPLNNVESVPEKEAQPDETKRQDNEPIGPTSPALPRVIVQGPEASPPGLTSPAEQSKSSPPRSDTVPGEAPEKKRSNRLREQLARLQNALSN